MVVTGGENEFNMEEEAEEVLCVFLGEFGVCQHERKCEWFGLDTTKMCCFVAVIIAVRLDYKHVNNKTSKLPILMRTMVFKRFLCINTYILSTFLFRWRCGIVEYLIRVFLMVHSL